MVREEQDGGGVAVRVLIVDDDDDIRDLLRLTMELAGHDVVGEAVDAPTALHTWTATGPDLVITDHRLPGDSGLVLADRILELDPAARIILFSAYLDEDALARAAQLGIPAVPKDLLRDLPALAGAA